MVPINIAGRRFGRLIAVETVRRKGRLRWKCLCDCGRETVVACGSLRYGDTVSCGCFKRDWIAASLSKRTHGEAGPRGKRTPEYESWAGMLQRCENRAYRRFYDWGGRGISVCERWHDFSAFLSDMGRRPSSKHSIDRINNDGNYEPANCRWANASQQRINRRDKKA